MTVEDASELKKAKTAMEIFEFEELRGDKDTDYWIKYNMRFGSMHLINPTHRLSYRQVYDLDIKLALILTIWLSFSTTKMMIYG